MNGFMLFIGFDTHIVRLVDQTQICTIVVGCFMELRLLVFDRIIRICEKGTHIFLILLIASLPPHLS